MRLSDSSRQVFAACLPLWRNEAPQRRLHYCTPRCRSGAIFSQRRPHVSPRLVVGRCEIPDGHSSRHGSANEHLVTSFSCTDSPGTTQLARRSIERSATLTPGHEFRALGRIGCKRRNSVSSERRRRGDCLIRSNARRCQSAGGFTGAASNSSNAVGFWRAILLPRRARRLMMCTALSELISDAPLVFVFRHYFTFPLRRRPLWFNFSAAILTRNSTFVSAHFTATG